MAVKPIHAGTLGRISPRTTLSIGILGRLLPDDDTGASGGYGLTPIQRRAKFRREEEQRLRQLTDFKDALEVEPPETLPANLPVDINAPALGDIKDDLDREIAQLMRMFSIMAISEQQAEEALKIIRFRKISLATLLELISDDYT